MNTPPHPGLTDGPVYLDYNATTPVDPRVLDAALPYLTMHFGNPSSAHHYARAPRAAVDQARAQVAELLAATPGEIVFTGGGSEADTLALRGAALAHRDRGNHLISQPTEHPAVLQTLHTLHTDGFDVTLLPVDRHGHVRPDDLGAALTDRTILVSVMLANGETGTLQPLAELARLAHARGALVHTDAAQAAGKIPINVDQLGVDLLSIAGHKLYAPKGVGALYLRTGTPLAPILPGGGQEQGLRAGTENVAFIAALGAAAHLATTAQPAETARLARLRDRLHHQLDTLLPGRVHLNGHPTHRLPGTLNITITGIRARDLLAATPEIAASTGSACHEGIEAPSPVLSAMGLTAEQANGALRLSLGRWTTTDDIDRAAHLIATHATSHTQQHTHARA